MRSGDQRGLQSLVYSAPGDDPVTYTASELIQHSWSFWFRQAGREAASSAAQVFHSYVEHDSALHTMRFNDKVKRGTVGFGGLEHYYRGSVNSFPNDRSPETLHNTPTLMLPGHRRLVLGQYDREDLNLPIGTQASPVTLRNVDPYATGMGWEQEEHSDLRYQPFFRIYTWYDQFVRLAADVP